MAEEKAGGSAQLGGLSISPQTFPIVAASVANGLSTILTIPQMLLLGNFLSIVTSSLFAISNVTAFGKAASAGTQTGTTTPTPSQNTGIPFLDYGPID